MNIYFIYKVLHEIGDVNIFNNPSIFMYFDAPVVAAY